MKWFRRSKPADSKWEQQSVEIAAAKQWRLAQTATRRDLVLEVSRILFDADPIGINFESNTDEYDSEAETIVIGLPETSSPADVQTLAHETFVQWFDAKSAGPPDRYRGVAAEIWNLWQRHQGRLRLSE